jgi:hypothetical protein
LLDKSKFVFIDKNDGHYLTARCRNLEIILNEITAKKKTVENIKRWIKENSFGTIDHVSLRFLFDKFLVKRRINEQI